MRLSHSFSSMKMYENCPLRYYYQRISKEVRDQPGEASIYGERIHKHLEDRLKEGTALPDESEGYEKLAAQIEAKAAGKTLLLEQELTLNENLTPTGWWDADAWMRSKLDVLVLHKDRAFVGDWKTGKRRPDFFQLELFALQVFAHYEQVQTVTSAFIWLKDNAIDAETYTRDEEPVLWSKMLGKVTRIAESAKRNKWPAKPSGLCPYCPAKDICEYH
jgi:CRISPR/Cas system-associated exonuclease Cas4 (RecB family)